MDKPKYKINNFNKNNIYWLRNMLPVNVAGNSILTPGYYCNKKYDDGDITSLGTIDNITGMSEIYFEDTVEFGSAQHLVMVEGGISASEYLYMIPRTSGSVGKDFGQIHQVEDDATYNSNQGIGGSDKPDTVITKNNTLIYPNATRLGMGYYKKATGGSATTLIDTATDFPLLGCGTDDWNEKLFDFQLGTAGEEFIVTSFSGGKAISAFADYSGTVAGTVLVTSAIHGFTTGDSVSIVNTTNYDDNYTVTVVSTTTFYITHSWDGDDATGNAAADTLNFSAGTGTPAADDEFMVFIDDKFDFEVNEGESNQHFWGQAAPENWKRQIELFGDDYFIGNGNYLASLNVDESTFSATGKQLPELTQFQCMKNNGDTKILVGGEYRNNRGRLMLWDGWTDGWLSILDTVNIPTSIVAYKSGWIIAFSDGDISYTDGYSITSMTKILDTEIEIGTSYPADNFNSMTILNNRLFIGVYSSLPTNRKRNGIHIYDIKNDIWSFSAIETKYSYNSQIGAVECLYPFSFIDGSNNAWEIYYGFKDCVGYIDNGSAPYTEAWLRIQLPYAQKISQIGLNLGVQYWNGEMIFQDGNTVDINVAVSNGKRAISSYANIGATSTVSKLVPSSANFRGYIEAGNEIEIIGSEHSNAGEYTFVTSVDDSGTASEAWNISPSLTSDPSGTRLCTVYNTKKCDTRTLTYGDLDKEVLFNVPDFYSDTLFVHVRIGQSNNYLDINQFNIY